MRMPEKINAKWVDSLSDADLVQAEYDLRGALQKQETAERKRRGAAYQLLRGPEALTQAWNRWSFVGNALRLRGLRVRQRPETAKRATP